jgi:hypothetical protein
MLAKSVTAQLPHNLMEKIKHFECVFDISYDKLTATSHTCVDCIEDEGCYCISSPLIAMMPEVHSFFILPVLSNY